MSTTDSQPGTTAVALDEQLKADKSGELRDRILDELHVATDEIRAALGGDPGAADAAVLRSLLDSTGHGERIVVEVWNEFHGTYGNGALLPG